MAGKTEKVELKAEKREELGKKAKKVRKMGLIPAVVYGRKFKSMPVSVDAREYRKKVLQSDAGHNLLFSLNIKSDGKTESIPVISHAIDRNPMTDDILHLDLMHVIMDEVIRTEVPVVLLGIPIGVKDDGGVLVHGLRDIEVECLPGNIPEKFEIDVKDLKVNDSLHVSDIKISENIKLIAEAEDMIVNVSPPTKEEEEVPPPVTPEEAAAAAAVEAGGEGAVADEQIKEKSAPGAPPAEKPTSDGKKEAKDKK
jgi:large subunit ribosomal protein L25